MLESYARTTIVVFCYILKDDKVLLIERGKPPYKGDRTVVGGKKELGENLSEACKREVFEETGLTLNHLELRALFTNRDPNSKYDVLTTYFISRDFSGELRESDEGKLKWVNIDETFDLEGINPYYLAITPHVLGDAPLAIGTAETLDGKLISLSLDQ